MPNEIAVVFHNGSNYYYDSMIKELQMSLEDNLNVLKKTKKNTKLFLSQ